MPNWCSNDVTLRNADPYAIDRAVKAFQERRLFAEFIPCPEELLDPRTGTYGGSDAEENDALRQSLTAKYGYSGWYDWCIANWGTKWDVGGADCSLERISTTEVALGFDSAWGPPIDFFRGLEEQGFEVEAYFNEPGMCFFGSYVDGFEDTVGYSGMTAEQIRAEFPEMDQRFGITDWMDDSEENLEIDLDGGLSSINE